MKEIWVTVTVVMWKLPPREMSCQRFHEIFPPAKITTFTLYSIKSALTWITRCGVIAIGPLAAVIARRAVVTCGKAGHIAEGSRCAWYGRGCTHRAIMAHWANSSYSSLPSYKVKTRWWKCFEIVCDEQWKFFETVCDGHFLCDGQ